MPRKKTADREVDTQAIATAAKAHNELMLNLSILEREYGDGQPFHLEKSIQKTTIHLANSAQSMLLAGREMVRIKEHLPHGEFQDVIEQRLKLNYKTANRMMAAAVKLSSMKRITTAVTTRSKMLELLTLDDQSLDALDKGGSVVDLKLDDVDCMTVSELRTELRKAKEKAGHDKETHEKQLRRKDDKLNDLDRKLHEKDAKVEVDWPKEIQGMNIDVTVAAYEVLKGLEKLDVFRDAILNFEPNHEMKHGELSDACFDAMAVVYYDACAQAFQHANELMHRCHEVFTGYKNKARPMFDPDHPEPLPLQALQADEPK